MPPTGKRPQKPKPSTAASAGHTGQQEESQRLQNLLCSVPGVVWEAWGEPDAANQRIDYVSPYVETMLGYTQEEWLSTPNFWLTIVHPDDKEAAAARAHETFVSGEGGLNHFRWITKDGRAIHCEAQAVVIKDENGTPVGMRGVTMDVTARKQTEIALIAAQRRFETTLHSIGDAVIATDDQGRVTFVNPVAADLTGWTPERAVGKPLDEVFVIVNEQTRKSVESPVSKVLREGNIVGLANHTVLISRDGLETPIDDSGAPIRDEQGAITGVVLVFRDIAERRKLEVRQQFLARSSDVLASSLDYEATLQSVADLAVPQIGDWCAIDLLDEDGSARLVAVAHVNPDKVKWARELRAQQPVDMSAPQGLPNVLRTGESEIYPHISDAMLVAAAKTEEDLRLMREIGFRSVMIVPLVARGRTLGAITFVATTESNNLYTTDDLTLAEGLASRAALAVDNARLFREARDENERRRKVEEELRSSRAQLEVILEGIGVGITVQDATGKLVYANSEAAEAAGYSSAEEFVNSSVPSLLSTYELLDQDGNPFDVNDLPGRRVLRGEEGAEAVVRFRKKGNGEESWSLIKATPVLDDEGHIMLAINFFQNITERQRAEEARARLAAIVESAEDAIVSKNLDGIVTSWNASAERLYGWKAEEIIGKSKALVIPSDLPNELATILQSIRQGRPIEHYETRRMRKDGTIFDVSITVSPVKDSQGRVTGASTIVRDISDRKQAENELRQRQREVEMLNERLRRSMQETHHRVKNNLQIIAAIVDMQAMGDPEEIAVEDLQRLGSQIRTLAVVHDILTHDAKARSDALEVSARAVLEKLLPLMEATAGDRHIWFNVDEIALPTRQGTSLALVVNELVSNALKHGSGEVSVGIAAENGSVVLTVEDKGPGFPAGFDPVESANTGLELVEHLTQWDLGGEARYGNRPEGGARVVVTFRAGVAAGR